MVMSTLAERKSTQQSKKSGTKSGTRSTQNRSKSASSRNTGGSRSNGSSGKSAKMTAAQKKEQEQHLLEKRRQHNQVRAILLFACALLLICMVLIPGDNVWNALHNFLLGMFGTWAILWPILLIYVAVMTAMEKSTGKMRGKVILSSAVIIMACSASYIFSDIQFEREIGYFPLLGELYQIGQARGGSGLSGGLLGYPFVSLLGGIGSKIAILLVLFVAIMILTGTTLIQLFRTMAKPAKVVAENVSQVREQRENIRRVEMERTHQTSEIDIALDGESKSRTARKAAGKPEAEPASNEKQEKLFNAFGIEQQPAKTETSSGKKAEEAPTPEPAAPAGPRPLPASAEAAVKAAREAFFAAANTDKAVREEKRSIQHSVQAAMQSPAVIQPQPAAQSPKADLAEPVPAVTPAPEIYPEPVQGGGYVFPPVSMLAASRQIDPELELEEQQHNGQLLVQTLRSFGVQTKILDICRGPAVTRYELQPAAGVKISKITNLSDDLAMNLAASGVRIEAPIPGKVAVGIEVPNKHKSIVHMRELIESNAFMTSRSKLTVALGRDIAGQVACADLGKMPHILIAGTTGSGKSVCINSLIISLLYKSTPEEVRLLMIDPKVVELGIYNGIPQLLVPVVTDPRKAAGALGWAVTEMLNRYKTFADFSVRDLAGYNKLAESKNFQDDDGQPMPKMPQIVIIIDELSDLMMAAPNEVEDAICRLAQMARAAGMHLVVATQRPSVDVVTGLIKANIPSRIAFAVSSAVDSRTILDTGGAEKLLGQGDMLFAPVGCQKPVRIQGCFVSDSEIESIVNFVKHTHEEVGYDDKIMEEIEKNAAAERDKSSEDTGDSIEDPMLNDAIKCVVEAGQASTSLLQRRLRLGYARAGRLIDEMEQLGIVGPHEGSKPRQVLMSYQQWLERTAQQPD